MRAAGAPRARSSSDRARVQDRASVDGVSRGRGRASLLGVLGQPTPGAGSGWLLRAICIVDAMPKAELRAASPEVCGVHSGRLHNLFACAQTLVSDGVVDACSIAVCRNGQLAGALALGCDPQGRAVQPDSLFHMYSATKVLVVSTA